MKSTACATTPGNKLGYLKAMVYFALRRPDLAEPFREYLESSRSRTGRQAVAKPGAHVHEVGLVGDAGGFVSLLDSRLRCPRRATSVLLLGFRLRLSLPLFASPSLRRCRRRRLDCLCDRSVGLVLRARSR